MSTELVKLWEDIPLRPYLGEIAKRHGYIETIALPNLRDLRPLRIESMFIQPLISTAQVDPSTSNDFWPDGATLLDALQENHSIVLLGDPGSGKTTLSNWLAWRLSAGLNSPLPAGLNDALPIPCILRDLDLAALAMCNVADMAVAIGAKLLGNRLDSNVERSIRQRVAAGKFVLILDGADEIPSNQRRTVALWMQQVAELGGFALATARIIGYQDFPLDREPERLGIRRTRQISITTDTEVNARNSDSTVKNWAVVRYMMPFDNQRIASFVENWYSQRCAGTTEAKQKSADLLAALDKSEAMQKLGRTPNLLSLMAIVHRERANLPDGKALLYKEISNAYINSIDQQRKIVDRDPLATYSWETRESWVAYVGFQMQLIRQSSDIGRSGILVDQKMVVNWLCEAMTWTFVENPEIRAQEFLEWIARRSGLLVPRGEGVYAFAHLSFQEYFCARFLATQVMSRSFIRGRVSANGHVDEETLSKWAAEPIWREAFIFFFEIISAENESGWVEEFIELLLGPNKAGYFDNSHAKLAARIIADQHIHFAPELRSLLAEKSSHEAFDEWRYFATRPERAILKYLLETGYATAAVDTAFNSKQAEGLKVTATSSLHKALPDCYILILENIEGSVLSNMPKLQQLRFVSITKCEIKNLNFLQEATKLEALELRETPVASLRPLASSANLNELDISDTKVRDISLIPNFKSLEILDLNGCSIKDYSPLRETNLRILALRRVQIESLSDIASIQGLYYLDLDSSSVQDLSELAKLKELRGIGIGNTKVKDLSPLSDLKDLERLDIEVCGATNPEIIGKLKELQLLQFGPRRPCDLSFIGRLKKLKSLTLFGPFVTDLSFVEHMPSLTELKLKSSSLTIADLKGLKKEFQHLSLNGRSISTFELKQSKRKKKLGPMPSESK